VSPSRILAIARRIAQGFRRDERTLGLMFVVPLVVTALLGWVLQDTKDTVVDVVIVNEAGPIGDRIVTALTDAANEPESDISIAATVGTVGDAVERIRDGTGDIAIVIPSDLLAAVQAGNRPTLTIISEGTDPAAEAGRFGTLQSAIADIAGQLAPPGVTPPIVPQVERKTVYLSPDASQVDVLAPIFLGFFGYFFVFLLTGISFLRERIGGTLERLLATPVTRFEIVTGYSLGFGTFATIQVIVLTLFILNSIDVPAFGPSQAFTIGPLDVPALGPTPPFSIGLGVDTAGSPFLAFAIALLLSLGAVNLGIFLSTFARTELQVIQFIPLVIVPQALLSGILWPVERLPDVLQAIAHVLPLTYAVEGLREVMLKGSDLTSITVQNDLAVLAGIALFFVFLASLTIKREVA
jgi:ABC-2 type transport system permease protein